MTISKDWIEKKYLNDHLTLEQIGEELGVSRQAVHYYVKKFGVDVTNAESFDTTCNACGKKFRIYRKRYTRSINNFCSQECHTKYLSNGSYVGWRQGQRIAREIMSKKLGRPLAEGEVVHHIDCDDTNNDPENLMLFASNSEHMAYHHKLKRERLQPCSLA